MADKIVILEDAEGNNIYPISRGLATNSVDTNAIQNGAVTSTKIDSATLDTSDIEVASGYSFNSSGTLARRVAGVVYFYKTLKCPAITTTDNTTVAFTLPEGWRPSVSIRTITQCGTGNLGRVQISSAGEVTVSKVSTDITSNSYAQLQSLNFITY